MPIHSTILSLDRIKFNPFQNLFLFYTWLPNGQRMTCNVLLFDFLNRHLEQTVRSEIALWFEWDVSMLKYSCRKTCQMQWSAFVIITNKIFSHAVLKSGILKYACAQFSWCYTKWHENNVIPWSLDQTHTRKRLRTEADTACVLMSIQYDIWEPIPFSSGFMSSISTYLIQKYEVICHAEIPSISKRTRNCRIWKIDTCHIKALNPSSTHKVMLVNLVL